MSVVDSLRVSRYPRVPENDATATLRIDGESYPAAVLYAGTVHGRRAEELRAAGFERMIVVRYDGRCATKATLGVDGEDNVANLRYRDGEILSDPVEIIPLDRDEESR